MAENKNNDSDDVQLVIIEPVEQTYASDYALLARILSFLAPYELFVTCLVNKAWKEASLSPILWVEGLRMFKVNYLQGWGNARALGRILPPYNGRELMAEDVGKEIFKELGRLNVFQPRNDDYQDIDPQQQAADRRADYLALLRAFTSNRVKSAANRGVSMDRFKLVMVIAGILWMVSIVASSILFVVQLDGDSDISYFAAILPLVIAGLGTALTLCSMWVVLIDDTRSYHPRLWDGDAVAWYCSFTFMAVLFATALLVAGLGLDTFDSNTVALLPLVIFLCCCCPLFTYFTFDQDDFGSKNFSIGGFHSEFFFALLCTGGFFISITLFLVGLMEDGVEMSSKFSLLFIPVFILLGVVCCSICSMGVTEAPGPSLFWSFVGFATWIILLVLKLDLNKGLEKVAWGLIFIPFFYGLCLCYSVPIKELLS